MMTSATCIARPRDEAMSHLAVAESKRGGVVTFSPAALALPRQERMRRFPGDIQ